MKNLSNLLRMIVLVASIGIIVSCSDNKMPLEDEDLYGSNLKSTINTLPDEINGKEFMYDLIAGQNTVVGSVSVSNDDEFLYVVYRVNPGCTLQETHLYVGSLTNLPKNKKGNPVIGHFPYSTIMPDTIIIYKIDLSDLPEKVIVAAHAVVCCSGMNCETAWGKPSGLITIALKSWFNKLTIWGGTNGQELDPTSVGWCENFGYVTFNPVDDQIKIFEIYQQSYTKSRLLANLKVEKIDNSLILDLIPTNANKISLTYLYVGTLEELYSYMEGTCPVYSIFPYRSRTNDIANPHFVINISSFNNNVVGENRWGWYLEYFAQ